MTPNASVASNSLQSFRRRLSKAKFEVRYFTTHKGLERIIGTYPIEELSNRGVKIQIAAPINRENLGIAKNVARFAEVRHIERPEIRAVLIDGVRLFQTPIPRPEEDSGDPALLFEDLHHTTERAEVLAMVTRMDSIWQNGIPIHKRTRELVSESIVER